MFVHQGVDLVEQRGGALNFVDDDPAAAWQGADLLAERIGIAQNLKVLGRAQEIEPDCSSFRTYQIRRSSRCGKRMNESRARLSLNGRDGSLVVRSCLSGSP
jgi:hypothetical protein